MAVVHSYLNLEILGFISIRTSYLIEQGTVLQLSKKGRIKVFPDLS